jgi:hypothetical protein
LAFTTVAPPVSSSCRCQLTVRNQVRQTVASNSNRRSGCWPSSRRGASAELRAQAETLADNATLKAALDTYQAETRGSSPGRARRSVETIDLVPRRSPRIDSDAIVLVDSHAGRACGGGAHVGSSWPRSRPVALTIPSKAPEATESWTASREWATTYSAS